MKYQNDFYNLYKKNYYSQNGEDGIINELLSRLNIKGGWLCEFGAGNGVTNSNTLQLIDTNNYKGVFIEYDEKEFNAMVKNHNTNENLILLHKEVSHQNDSENSLDNILKTTPIPTINDKEDNFIVLSIDIDGYDYQVWNSLQNYKPIIVIIEINSNTDPTDEKHIHNGNNYKQSSFMATYKLGISKGYTFVCHTGNMIFLRNDYFKKAGIKLPVHPLYDFRRVWLSQKLHNKIENI